MKVSTEQRPGGGGGRLLVFVAVALCLAGSPLGAQTPIALPADSLVRTHDDSSKVRMRAPDTQALRSYQTDRAYRYDRDTTPPQDLTAKFMAWLDRLLGDLFRSQAYQSVGQYALLVAILGAIVWLLRKADVLGFMFPAKAKQVPLDYENLNENIHEINFDDRIDEALAGRNYRLAVRLLYLRTLRHLADRHLIIWQPDKTNRQYANELASTLRPDFEQLTTQFEFVWYGDFPIDERHYGDLADKFKAFDAGEITLTH